MAGPYAEVTITVQPLVAISSEEAVIHETVAEEDDQDRALEPTIQEYRQIEDKLTELGNPTTHAGMRAMARASVAWAPKDPDGEVTAGIAGLAERLAFAVVESLAGGAGMSAAAEHPGLDTELLAACEAFHATHAEMKDPRRGHTEADREALAVVTLRWYTRTGRCGGDPGARRGRAAGQAPDGLHRAR